MSVAHFRFARVALAAALFGVAADGAAPQTEIQFWHSMTGALGDRVNDLAKRFNESQKEYKVVPVFKGSYPESMAATVAASRAGNAPHILQVFEVGTATMMAGKGRSSRSYEVMARGGREVRPEGLRSRCRRLLHDAERARCCRFPFNSSTPVFYYNKDAFKKAGLDPEQAAEDVAGGDRGGRQAQGRPAQKCPFTTGWQSWTQLESFSAWHNVAFATKEQRLRRHRSRSSIVQQPAAGPPHREPAGLVKKGCSSTAAASNEAESKFSQRRVRDDDDVVGRVRRTSSATPSSRSASRRCRTTPTSPGAPQNTIIGGASLWVMAGKKTEEYKGVAKFFDFLSQPEVQAQCHQETGYLPITIAAYELTEEVGLLREESRHRRLGRADDRQDDQQLARRARSATSCRSATRSTRSSKQRLGRQEDRQGRVWTSAVKRGNEQHRPVRQGAKSNEQQSAPRRRPAAATPSAAARTSGRA